MKLADLVTFKDGESMKDAIEWMNGENLNGQNITVNEAQSRRRRDDSGSGGGLCSGGGMIVEKVVGVVVATTVGADKMEMVEVGGIRR
ncbi:hypothetical protein U1Q18_025196 [Sarracenia purpurea var. burkii]